MDLHQAVDIYCERSSALFWAEPVNAISNAAFLIAALMASHTARSRGITAPIVWVLIAMTAMIGAGSFLFHTFANRWSEYADTIPIWSFVAVFVLTAMRVIGGMAPRRIALWGGFVVGCAVLTITLLATGEGSTGPDPLNGSGQYAPAVIALLVFTALSYRRGHPGAPWIAAATALFAVSLTFRTLDRDLCAIFPMGTHFIWHLLNGAMVGILLQMLIRTGHFTRATVR